MHLIKTCPHRADTCRSSALSLQHVEFLLQQHRYSVHVYMLGTFRLPRLTRQWLLVRLHWNSHAPATLFHGLLRSNTRHL